MIWTLPNLLTVLRLAAAPVLLLGYGVLERPAADWLALALFVSASLTDFLDGWLARRLGQESALGATLDPLADKAMVAAALVALIWIHSGAALIMLPTLVILGREALVSWLRARIGGASLPVTQLAKWKTTAQMVAIALLLWVAAERTGLDLALAGAPEAGSLLPYYFDPRFDLSLAREMLFWFDLAALALLWFAALLTGITGWDYLRKGLAHMRRMEGG